MIREVARYLNYWNAEPNKIHQVQLHPDSLSLSWPLWRRSTHATPINVEVNRGVAVAANLYTAWKLSASFGCWLLLLLGFFCFFFFFNFLMLVTWNACRASRKYSVTFVGVGFSRTSSKYALTFAKSSPEIGSLCFVCLSKPIFLWRFKTQSRTLFACANGSSEKMVKGRLTIRKWRCIAARAAR